MITRETMLRGDSLRANRAPPLCPGALVTLPGTAGGKAAQVGFSEETLQMHLLLMGGTGAGKTNAMRHILPQLQRKMSRNDVMLVYDSKLDFDRSHRDSDYVITYRGDCRGTRVTWNLFMDLVADGWGKEDIFSNADEIADVIFSQAVKESSQPFFPKAARDVFSAILKAMALLGANDKAYRVKYMNNRALMQYLTALDAEKLRAFLAPVPELSGVLKYVGNGRSEQALGVFAELQAAVGHIFTRDFGGDGRFSVRRCVKERQGTTLFIEYDPSRGRSLQPVHQLLVDLFLKEALLPKEQTKGRVFVLFDELKMLPRLNHLEDALNFGRSLGVCVIAGIQSMEQLYEVYGEYGGKNIAAAFQSVLCFHTNDAASRQYVKGIFGENMSVLQYVTPSGKTVEEKHVGNSVEDWEITALERGEAIVGLPYQKPFKFKPAKYAGG